MSRDYWIETERLRLFPWPNDEVKLFLEINTAPFVLKHLWDNDVITYDAAKDILKKNAEHFEKDRYGLWQIKNRAGGGWF